MAQEFDAREADDEHKRYVNDIRRMVTALNETIDAQKERYIDSREKERNAYINMEERVLSVVRSMDRLLEGIRKYI